MLQQPFRNLTPVVSGLTEIPDVSFFADNRVEIGVIMARINESVFQLTDILNNLDCIEISRPLPSEFSFPSNYTNENEDKNVEEPKNEVLSKSYLSASLNFIIGRCALQKKDFNRAFNLFDLTLSDMKLDNVRLKNILLFINLIIN